MAGKINYSKDESPREDKELIEEISLEELTEGSNVFKANGLSKIKVTQGEKVKRLSIPIKSTGVTELIEEFQKKRPMPPVIHVVVRPGDPAYKEMRLTKKQHVKTFDLTDEAYLDELEKYNSQLGLKIVLQGLNMVIKDRDGNVVEDEDKKITILREAGLSGHQFSQLVRDIKRLTAWEDENEDDFLPF